MRRPIKPKNQLVPDPRYNSLKVAQFINYVMERGKKSLAQRIVYGSFDQLQKGSKLEPLDTFEAALKNVGPHTELRSRRVGGANYQIPYEVEPRRRQTLAMKWIIQAARAKSGQPIVRRLADELLAASQDEGEAVKRRDTVLKMAEANRAFAHFARSRKSPKA